MRLFTVLALMLSLMTTAAMAQEQPKATLHAHLASYKGHLDAEKAWRILAEQYSSVLYFSPRITEVDIPGKGKFQRLSTEGDEEMTRSLCKSLRERKLYCALLKPDGSFLRE